MRILRARDRMPTPWKNGGGVTREVAIWPPTAAFDAFGWRISIAEVARGGPFSTFPGIDRLLTVIEGAGLELSVEGLPVAILDDHAPPFAFPGDAACTATLRHGPIRDLNLMVRRGAYVARARRLEGSASIECTAQTTLVLALTATEVGGGRLESDDAVILEQGARLGVGPGHLILAEIDPA